METKICLKCKKEQPATTEYFSRNKTQKDKLAQVCKFCSNLNKRLYIKRLKNREKSKIIIPIRKRCPKCKKLRLSKKFYRTNSRIDGLSDYCKNCCKLNSDQKKHRKYYRLQKYQNNVDEEIAAVRRYQEKMKSRKDDEIPIPKRKKCNKCKKIKSSNKFNKTRLQHDGLQTYCRECSVKLNQANRANISARNREYHRKNKERIREYTKNREKNNPIIRIIHSLRNRISSILRSQNAVKSDHTIKLLGCSALQFKKYLESKFLPGMTWDNYGKFGWHVDHIKPLAAFNLLLPAEQRRCFNYKNSQPMWHLDNWRKNSIYKGKLIRRKML